MSSKRAIRRKACDGKTRFSSFQQAHQAMRALIRKVGNEGRPMDAYHCNFCNGFHFGHVPLRLLNARADARRRA
jgi:hypothetical protein